MSVEHVLIGELLWMVVDNSATVHPLQLSKQPKVTSEQLGLYIPWLVVYVVWRWEQRVVDADSKEGISSSYFLCVCVCGVHPHCTCTRLCLMWLMLNTVVQSEQEMKAFLL